MVAAPANSQAYEGVEAALSEPGVDVRLFGKPTTRPYRRMAVALAKGPNALARARAAAAKITVVTPWLTLADMSGEESSRRSS